MPIRFLGFKAGSNSGCGCCQPCIANATVQVTYCPRTGGSTLPVILGIPVSILSGMTVVASGSTNAAGIFTAQLPTGPGDYTVQVTYNGVVISQVVNFVCTIQQIAEFVIWSPQVLGCIGAAVAGATATVPSQGGPQTTDNQGYCLPGWIFPAGSTLGPNPPFSFPFTVSFPPRFADLSGAVTNHNVVFCGTLQLQAASGYVCANIGFCLSCNLPIKTTMDFTDLCLGTGVATFDPVGGPTGGPDWVGTLTVSTAVYGVCPCPASTTTITYYLIGQASTNPFAGCGQVTWTANEPCHNTFCPAPGPLAINQPCNTGLQSCPEGFLATTAIGHDAGTYSSPWSTNGCVFPVNVTWTES